MLGAELFSAASFVYKVLFISIRASHKSILPALSEFGCAESSGSVYCMPMDSFFKYVPPWRIHVPSVVSGSYSAMDSHCLPTQCTDHYSSANQRADAELETFALAGNHSIVKSAGLHGVMGDAVHAVVGSAYHQFVRPWPHALLWSTLKVLDNASVVLRWFCDLVSHSHSPACSISTMEG
jgi:hypothetical protein